jgi:hypothetical protein
MAVMGTSAEPSPIVIVIVIFPALPFTIENELIVLAIFLAVDVIVPVPEPLKTGIIF